MFCDEYYRTMVSSWRVVLVLACTPSIAGADIESRSYKALGDVVYVPQDDVPSCGKPARDLLKNAVRGIRGITVGSQTLQVNNGTPQDILQRTETAVLSHQSRKDPIERFPDRVITMGMVLVQIAESDYSFALMRTVESGGARCSDSYVVSVE